ncbi:MAG: hypothetical protein LAT81_02700 [Oceanicaulis sp.]|nr:hypothetical protein [Oceanicaulis sp.]
MTENLVRAPGRAPPADAIAAAAGALFAGVCIFCAAGGFVWALCYMAGLPMIVIGGAELVTGVISLALVWLLFRAGLRYAASGFETG